MGVCFVSEWEKKKLKMKRKITVNCDTEKGGKCLASHTLKNSPVVAFGVDRLGTCSTQVSISLCAAASSGGGI
jgi:hypothetical protein